MAISCIPRAALGIAFPDSNVARQASATLFPAQGALCSSQEGIGWAFENVLGLADVRSQPGPLLVDEKVEVGVVGAGAPIQPPFDPAWADGGIEIAPLGVTA